jgi:hypothetical protein
MKLKLEMGLVQCRISREEAQTLRDEGAINETIILPGGAGYVVAIGTMEDLPAPQFSFDPSGPNFVFYISTEDAKRLATEPLKKGIEGAFEQGYFSIEVNVKDFAPKKKAKPDSP